MKHLPQGRAPTKDQPRIEPAKVAAILAVMVWGIGIAAGGVRTATAQQAVPSPKEGSIHDTPLVPMRASPLDRSLPELVASGWRVVGVTLSGRIFQYHLVGEGSLAICFVDTQGSAPASECIRLGSIPR